VAPEHKTKRTVRRFALWPTRLDGEEAEEMVWLETYAAYQEWYNDGYAGGWKTVARYSEAPV
jgi:hypothetical protein